MQNYKNSHTSNEYLALNCKRLFLLFKTFTKILHSMTIKYMPSIHTTSAKFLFSQMCPRQRSSAELPRRMTMQHSGSWLRVATLMGMEMHRGDLRGPAVASWRRALRAVCGLRQNLLLTAAEEQMWAKPRAKEWIWKKNREKKPNTVDKHSILYCWATRQQPERRPGELFRRSSPNNYSPYSISVTKLVKICMSVSLTHSWEECKVIA